MKLLIITYTYPPSKSVNGFRPYHFAIDLTKAGWEVSVLTRHFTGHETSQDYGLTNNTPFSTSYETGVVVYRTPFENNWFKYFNTKWVNQSVAWKIIYFINLLFGRTQQESYNRWFKKYLKYLLSIVKYDFLVVESGPTNLPRMASKLVQQFGLPYILDFRDAYYHEMYLKTSGSIPITKKIKIGLEKLYIKKCIQGAQLVVSLSSTLHDILEIPKEKRIIVSNGYDESFWSALIPSTLPNIFRVTVAGTLYDREFLSVFLQCFKVFLENNYPDIEILFLAPGLPTVIQKIKSTLNFKEVKIISDRIPYIQTLETLQSSQVLSYHGWSGYQGYPSAKIFEYIRSGKPILIVPSDHNAIDELVSGSATGYSFDDPNAAANQLCLWYKEWKNTGSIILNPNETFIRQYSRTSQNTTLIKSLNRLMESKQAPT